MLKTFTDISDFDLRLPAFEDFDKVDFDREDRFDCDEVDGFWRSGVKLGGGRYSMKVVDSRRAIEYILGGWSRAGPLFGFTKKTGHKSTDD